MTVPPAPRPRRRLSVEDRRSELIEAALELFSARPVEEVSVDDIAAAAGASRALLYHYFDSKTGLYRETTRRAADDLLAQLGELPADGDPDERLAAGVDRYLDYVEGHAAGYLALMRAGSEVAADSEVGSVLEDIRRRVVEVLLTGLGIADCPPLLRAALRGWLGFVERACIDWLEHRDVGREHLRALLCAVLPAAVAAAGAAGTGDGPLPGDL